MRRLVVLAISVFAVALYAACGSDATGVDECRQIETARCQAAPACPNVNLGVPPYATNAVDGCIAYYNDACLHGLEVADPGASAISACVNAITTAGKASPPDCFTVAFPQTNNACSWLAPPVTPDDAAVDDADADDGADDGAVVDAADGATD